MNKVQQIIHAIQMADALQSKLTPEVMAVPGFTSLRIRHLMNNLGAISNNFFEIGSHKGGTFCSAVFQNDHLQNAVAIDNFSEFNDGEPMRELISNVGLFKPGPVKFKLIAQDCWETKGLDGMKFDFYLYDGSHDFHSQRKACTHFLDVMADEFIFCVDDYSVWEHVHLGTKEGICESGCSVVFHNELYNGIEGDNHGWHNGLYVALMRKNYG